MLRTSSYTIYVDLPHQGDEMLLVHGYMGNYDRVSNGVATYLRSKETHRPPKPLYGAWSPEPDLNGEVKKPSDETLRVLKRRGYLTEKTPQEEEEFFEAVVEKIHQSNLQRMPRYMFIPTYNCNLRCSYCFQDHMRTDPQMRHLLRTIEPAVVDRTFKAMLEIEDMHGINGDGARNRVIGFFGGEPFLEQNRPIVEYIINKTLEVGKGNFWAVSNATDLHAYEDLLSPDLISSIQVTLDGPPAEHDKRRIYADGSGSFERIARNMTMALERGVRIHLRINLDRNNLHLLPGLADEVLARGWDQYPQFRAYAAAIHAQTENVDRKTTFGTWDLNNALLELREKFPSVAVIRRPDDGVKSNAHKVFEEPDEMVSSVRESFCTAHTQLYMFDAFANIYACWEYTGDPKVRIGRVTEDGSLEMNSQINNLWRGRTVASNPVCRKCRYALHCGGGCAALALARTGKFHINYCDGFASRFRASVAEAYQEHTSGVPAPEDVGYNVGY